MYNTDVKLMFFHLKKRKTTFLIRMCCYQSNSCSWLPTIQFHLAEFRCEWSMLPLWNPWIAWTKILSQRCLGAPTNHTETSAVSPDVQIREEMTKLTNGSDHITDFLRMPNKPALGWKWSVGIIGSLIVTINQVQDFSCQSWCYTHTCTHVVWSHIYHTMYYIFWEGMA